MILDVLILGLSLSLSSHVPEERVWKEKLSLLQGVETKDLAPQVEKALGLKVLHLNRASDVDKDAREFYEIYWKAQRYKAYSGFYFRKNSPLPKPIEDPDSAQLRPLRDRDLIVVSDETTRESFFHLILHALSDDDARLQAVKDLESAQREAKKAEDNRKEDAELKVLEKRLKVFLTDFEVEKDFFLLESSKDLALTDDDNKKCWERALRNLVRLERAYEFLKEAPQVGKIELKEADAKWALLTERKNLLKEALKFP